MGKDNTCSSETGFSEGVRFPPLGQREITISSTTKKNKVKWHKTKTDKSQLNPQ